MTVPTPLPEPSQSPNWAAQLNAAITDRYEDAKQAAADVADTINTGRLSEAELAATFLPKADTGAAGLALLAAALPADARESLDITVDTSVGTRVMVGGVMIYGDTGWRDISNMLINGWAQATTNRCRIRRNGNLVSWHAYLNPTAATNIIALELPQGGGFYTYDMTMPWSGVSGAAEGTAYIQRTGGRVTIPGAQASGGNIFIGGQWATDDPWPSNLPGSAA